MRECCYADCRLCLVSFMLSVIFDEYVANKSFMLSVIILVVIVLSDVMLIVIVKLICRRAGQKIFLHL